MERKTQKRRSGEKKPHVSISVTPEGTVTEVTVPAPSSAEEIKNEIPDIEVARKMLKISQSAADRKLEYNLTFDTVKKLMTHKTCFYTGKTFGEEGSPTGRSFDRVDSSKGYVEGNVVACTIDINQKKANLTFEEISCIYNKIAKRLEKSS